MRRTAHLLLIALLLAACGGWRGGDRLLKEAERIIENYPDSALRLLESLDTKRSDRNQRALHDLLLTEASYKLYKPIANDSLISSAIVFFEQENDRVHLANAYYYKGVVLYDLGAKEEAVVCLKKAEGLAESLDDELLRNKIYENLAYINLKSSNKELALRYSRRFLSSSKVLNDVELLARAYDKLSVSFSLLGNDSMAAVVYDSITPILSSTSDSAKAYILSNIAMVRLQENKTEEAKSLLLTSVQYLPKANEYLVLGKIALRQGDKDSACKYLEKAISFNDDYYSRKAYTVLADICSQTGDFKASSMYHKKADSIRHLVEMSKKTSELQAAQLNFDAEEVKAKKDARIRQLLVVTVILFFIIVSSFIFLYAKIRKSHEDLEEKAREIEAGISQIRLFKIREAELQREKQDSLSRQNELSGMVQSLNRQVEEMMDSFEKKKDEMSQFLLRLRIAESDIEERNAQLAEMKAQLDHACSITNAHLSRGKRIYDSLTEKSSVTNVLTKTDEECLIDYYIITCYDDYMKIISSYHALTLRLSSYLILKRMGLADDKIQKLLGVTNTTLRVYRSRLKKQQRK